MVINITHIIFMVVRDIKEREHQHHGEEAHLSAKPSHFQLAHTRQHCHISVHKIVEILPLYFYNIINIEMLQN